jgi:hypothetical protein
MSATAWTIKQATSSSTTVKPVGIVTNDFASGSSEIEVVRRGYVYMIGQDAMNPGDPVFPSSVAGRVIKTGAATPAFGKCGLGTVVVGASASGACLVQLQGLT